MENLSLNQNFESVEKSKSITCSLNELGNLDEQTKEVIDRIKNSGENIDFEKDADFNEKYRTGRGPYVISAISSKDKYSESYRNCTGAIFTGIDKNSNEEISILTHQATEKYFLELLGEKNKNNFADDLTQKIKELIGRSKEGTIDGVIFGGNDFNIDEYKNSVSMISKIFQAELGFEPTVMTGPNKFESSSKDTNVYFDAKNRHLYIVRQNIEDNERNHPYIAPEMDKKKWSNNS